MLEDKILQAVKKSLKDDENTDTIQTIVNNELKKYLNEDYFKAEVQKVLNSEEVIDKIKGRITTTINHALQEFFNVERVYHEDKVFQVNGKGAKLTFDLTEKQLMNNEKVVSEQINHELISEGKLTSKVSKSVDKYLTSDEFKRIFQDEIMPIVKANINHYLNDKANIEALHQQIQEKALKESNKLVNKIKITVKK